MWRQSALRRAAHEDEAFAGSLAEDSQHTTLERQLTLGESEPRDPTEPHASV